MNGRPDLPEGVSRHFGTGREHGYLDEATHDAWPARRGSPPMPHMTAPPVRSSPRPGSGTRGVLRGEGLAESHDFAEVLGKLPIADPDASVRSSAIQQGFGGTVSLQSWLEVYLPADDLRRAAGDVFVEGIGHAFSCGRFAVPDAGCPGRLRGQRGPGPGDDPGH